MNQILLMLGLNKSQFSSSLKGASIEAKAFGKEWNEMKKLFAAGGLLTVMVAFFRSVVEGAQASREALEKMGQPIPNHVRSVAAFADGLEKTKAGAMDFATFIVSGWTQIGESIGYAINRLRGYSEAEQNVNESSGRAADAAQARLAKARETNSPEKIAEAEAHLAQVRREQAIEQATGQEKLNLLILDGVRIADEVNATGEHSIKGAQFREELERNNTAILATQADIAKTKAETEKKAAEDKAKADADLKRSFEEDLQWVKEQDKNAAALKKAKFESLTIDQQAVELTKDIAHQTAAIAVDKKAGRDTTAQEATLQETVNDLAKTRADLAERTAKAEEKARKEAEGQAEALRRTQAAYEAIIFGITNGGASSSQIQQSSDAALAEKIRRNNSTLINVRNSAGVNPGGGNDITAEFSRLRLENENRRLQAELDARTKVRNDVGFLGVDGARRAFGGDPLVFDRLVDEFVKAQTEAGKTNRLLEDLVTRIGPDQKGNLPSSIESLSTTLKRGLDALTATMDARGRT